MLGNTKLNEIELSPSGTVAERWGDAVSAGFIPLPNALVRAQARLGLSSNDVVVILNILLHWYHSDKLPYPRTTAIAKRSGLGHRTVQRSLRNLEKKKLIARVQGEERRTYYDLTGLRQELAQQARQDVWHRPDVIRMKLPNEQIGARTGRQNPRLMRP
jgi:DNA-binding MarR family transcriptional regulator